MINKFLVLIILGFLCISCFAQTQNNFFGFVSKCIGVVTNDKVQFYAIKDEKWMVLPGMDFIR
jgi:hypothetical protein